ncbi:Sensor histidine kinase LiaS [Corynebacterium occultum]|uniref:Oxygen sensor histidine kinase NreB n=1 Tax=Corynebacterium occultum TaxID=2675219 RepID=A0A6B8WF21_9CORY|nr:sensor histidine kinase [Corynebacterium occultum]QGU08580.1 Sensor histidine kinase LiaS [Corynebacterium occultum]
MQTRIGPREAESTVGQEPGVGDNGLRNGIHVLTSVLLVVALGTAIRLPLTEAAITLLLCSLFAFIYFFGASLLSQWSPKLQLLWVFLLSGLWIAMLPVSSVAIYLVFTLFFLYLQVMNDTYGRIAVVAATAVAILSQAAEGLTIGGVMGPGVSALVTLAIHYAFRRLARANLERQELIDQLMATRSELAKTQHTAGVIAERQRIAHEIHDTLAQGLSSIQMLLHVAESEIIASPLSEEEKAAPIQRIQLARSAAAENLSEARAMIAALQPAALSQRSLRGALERVAANHGAVSGLDIAVDVDGAEWELPMKIEAALLRIAQGAVANAVAHSQAERCRISLSYGEEEVRLDVVDDGCGFDPGEVAQRPVGLGHVGLDAMRQRARELGGSLEVESAPGQGTAVSVALPREVPEFGA